MFSNHSISLKGFVIWLVCAVFFMYEFMLRTSLGTFETPIIHDLKLSLISFALVSSTAYTIIYGLMQIPVGVITDRFGLKASLTVAAFICALSVMGFSSVSAFKSAMLFRVLMGLGSSFGFICLLVCIYEWLPRQRLGFFIGISQFIGTLGPIMAAGPMMQLSDIYGLSWRAVFMVLGLIGLGISFLIFLLVQNKKNYAGGFQILKLSAPLSRTVYSIISQKQLWLVALYSGTVYFTIEYLSENSGKAFLHLMGYSSNMASYFLTIAWLGYSVACPLLGYLSDYFARRKPVMIFAALLGLISMLLILYGPSSQRFLFLAFFLLGMGASGQSVGFALVSEQCGDSYLAAGLGFNNAFIALVTSINAPLIGWLIHYFSKGITPTIASYQHAFMVIMFFLAMAFILSGFFIKETFCKSQKKPTLLSVSA